MLIVLSIIILDFIFLFLLYRWSLGALFVKNINDIDEIYPPQNQILLLPKKVIKKTNSLLIKWKANIQEEGEYYYSVNKKKGEGPITEKHVNLPLVGKKTRMEIKFVNKKNTLYSNYIELNNLSDGYLGHWFINKWENERKFQNKQFDHIDIGEKDYLIKKCIEISPDIDQLRDVEKGVLLIKIVQKMFPGMSAAQNYNYLNDSTSDIIKHLENGESGQCGEFAFVYVGLAKAIGIIARPIGCYWYTSFIPGIMPVQHVVSEIWSDLYQKWIVMDSTIGGYFKLGKLPLSAVEIHNLLIENRVFEISVCQDDKNLSAPEFFKENFIGKHTDSYANYFCYYKHLLFFKENFSRDLLSIPIIGKILSKFNNPIIFRKIPILNKLFVRYYHYFDQHTQKLSKTKYISWYLIDIYIFLHILVISISAIFL